MFLSKNDEFCKKCREDVVYNIKMCYYLFRGWD